MDDHINYITPQFRVPESTSSAYRPLSTRPTVRRKGYSSLDESFVVIHFRQSEGIDFPRLGDAQVVYFTLIH